MSVQKEKDTSVQKVTATPAGKPSAVQKEQVDVVVLGAGLTGLTAGFYLQKAGLNVRIVEREPRIGGVIKTIRQDGFLLEAGPNTGVFSTPELVRLFDDLHGACKPEFANQAAKQRWIWKSGKWHALPSGPVSAIKTPLFTFRDKIRVLGEPLRKKGKNPEETVAELVRRRLGRSFLDYAVDPFISGIYAGDPDKLITQYALPKLYALEQNYGSFIRGAIKKRKEPKDDLTKRATREVFSVEGGLDRLTDALGEKIGMDRIDVSANGLKVMKALPSSANGSNRNSSPINQSYPDHKNFSYLTRYSLPGGEQELESKMVVSTIGSYELVQCFPFLSEDVLAPIQSLEYAKVVEVVAAYKSWPGIPLTAFGGLIPSKEGRKSLGILFPSSIFTGRAPGGGAILSIFMGGMRHPEIASLNNGKIEKIAREEIEETLGTGTAGPDLMKIYRYQHAIPQYEISSGARFRAIEKIETEFLGLLLGGNIRDGIGMADRVKQGIHLAEKVTTLHKS